MKPKKNFGMWRQKALLIDTRKTRLIMESADVETDYAVPLVDSELVQIEQVPSCEHKTQYEMVVQEMQSESVEAEQVPSLNACALEGSAVLEPELENVVLDSEVTVSNVETIESNITEAPFMIHSTEDLTAEPNVESVVLEVTDLPESETTDQDCDMASDDEEPLNKFLRVLERTRAIWDDDKQFTKIIEKMKKGKNLKRKEFDRVHSYIRNSCQFSY